MWRKDERAFHFTYNSPDTSDERSANSSFVGHSQINETLRELRVRNCVHGRIGDSKITIGLIINRWNNLQLCRIYKETKAYNVLLRIRVQRLTSSILLGYKIADLFGFPISIYSCAIVNRLKWTINGKYNRVSSPKTLCINNETRTHPFEISRWAIHPHRPLSNFVHFQSAFLQPWQTNCSPFEKRNFSVFPLSPPHVSVSEGSCQAGEILKVKISLQILVSLN